MLGTPMSHDMELVLLWYRLEHYLKQNKIRHNAVGTSLQDHI